LKSASQVGQERMKDYAARLDDNVHANPWAYLGGVALAILIYALSQRTWMKFSKASDFVARLTRQR